MNTTAAGEQTKTGMSLAFKFTGSKSDAGSDVEGTKRSAAYHKQREISPSTILTEEIISSDTFGLVTDLLEFKILHNVCGIF